MTTTLILERQQEQPQSWTVLEVNLQTAPPSLRAREECAESKDEDDLAPQFDMAPTFLSSLASRLQSDVESLEKASSSAPKESHQHRRHRPTVFHGSKHTPIPIRDYVRRIAEHSKCSHVCFVASYWYLQRLSKVDRKYRLCRRSVHRLLISSVLIAAKLLDDKFYSNAFYARIGGISTKELNTLELEMLRLLDFRVFASHAVLRACLADISEATPQEPPPPAATPAGGEAVGRKRVNEDPSAETAMPAKLQHSTGKDQVLVTPKDSPASPKPRSASAGPREERCGSLEGHTPVTAAVLRASIDVGGS